MSSKKLHYEAISARGIVSGCSNEADAALFSVCLFYFYFFLIILVKFAEKYLGNLCGSLHHYCLSRETKKEIPAACRYSSTCAIEQRAGGEGTRHTTHPKTLPGTAGETECNS